MERRTKSTAERLREKDARAGKRRQPSRNGMPHVPADPWPEDQRGDADEGDPQPGIPDFGTLLSTVRPESVSWLWPARIPRAKLTILDGDPGLGKSVLTMDLAARVSAGLPMVDGTPCPAAGVVILNAEDGLADTVLPRLLAAGGDPSRVLALNAVPSPEEGERLVSLPLDLPYLQAAVRQVGAALVIIDPIMAYLGSEVNSHRDQDCRRALHPLAQMAADTGAAVVVVRHLNKMAGGNPLYRGGGSIGIIGAARSGLLVAKDPDNPDRRVLAGVKCNLARLPPSLAFDLSPSDNGGALRVGWMGESAHTAESLLAAPRDEEDRDAVQEAVDVLRAILESGALPSEEVRREARKAGVSERTLNRAKSVLGIKSRKVGFTGKGTWQWCLPAHAP